MSETFTKWDVVDHLEAKEDVRLYLEACIEEDPGDGSLIRAALNDVARARKSARWGRDAAINNEVFEEALSENGNPSFASVLIALRELGMQLRVCA